MEASQMSPIKVNSALEQGRFARGSPHSVVTKCLWPMRAAPARVTNFGRNLNEDLIDWPRAIVHRFHDIVFATIVVFGALSGLCYGADSPVLPTPTQTFEAPRDSTPTAEEIAAVVSARFHIGLPDALEIGHAALNAARRYTISPLLLLAMIAVESSFDRFAVSVVGAKGLMQVLPSQHRDRVLRTSDLTDARTNVRIGSAILHDYIRASDGNLEDALHRYSGGAKGYAKRVANHMRMMKAEFGLWSRPCVESLCVIFEK